MLKSKLYETHADGTKMKAFFFDLFEMNLHPWKQGKHRAFGEHTSSGHPKAAAESRILKPSFPKTARATQASKSRPQKGYRACDWGNKEKLAGADPKHLPAQHTERLPILR